MLSTDLIVVGAGPFGIIAAHTWLELHPNDNVMILEAGPDLGGVWSKSRIYSTMMTQSPVGMLEYGCLPMDSVPRSETFHDYYPGHYVESYLSKFSCHKQFAGKTLKERMIFNSPVKQIMKFSGGWIVEAGLPEATIIYQTRKLIMATGLASVPNIPKFSTASSSSQIIHSKDLAANETQLKQPDIKNVIVLGGRKSAFDAVQFLDSFPNIKSTTFIVRPDGKCLGPSILATPSAPWPLSNSHEIISTRLVSKMSPCIFEPLDFWARFFHGNNVIGRWLCDAVWWSVDHGWKSAARYDRNDSMKLLKPERPAFWSSESVAVYNSQGMWDAVGSAKVYRDEVVEYGEKEVVLASGTKLPCDAVIAATGWQTTYPMFSEKLARSLGLPLAKRQAELSVEEEKEDLKWKTRLQTADAEIIKTFPRLAKLPTYHTGSTKTTPCRLYRALIPIQSEEDRTIAFVGALATTQSFAVAEIQALWTCAYLSGKLDVPSKDEMEDSVALARAWRSRRYVGEGESIIYEQLQYTSMLLRDLGLDDLRKGGGWREILMPYSSKDYKDILAEWKNLAGWVS